MSHLRAEHLKKTFKHKTVVKDISFTLQSSEIVGLLGPNGAGKTTSFYMVVGLIPVTSGSIFLNDKNITNLTVSERSKHGLGYLPQEASIFRKLSVKDNVLAILELRRDLDKTQRQVHLERLLHEFRIEHLADTLGISLSGGERRRVEIARTLAIQPKFILLDEPFAGIDPIAVIDLKNIIMDLKNRGIGVLITDHNVRETLAVCERAYIVSDGTIISSGTPKEIVSHHKVREIYLGHEFDL